MAPFGHGAMSESSPLSGGERKSDLGAVRAAFNPKRALASYTVDRLLLESR
jgi:hypothetical protein